MHLVFLNQYYPPDAAPTGVMLEGLVEGLVRDGHEVTVLCAEGGYAGGRRGVHSSLPISYQPSTLIPPPGGPPAEHVANSSCPCRSAPFNSQLSTCSPRVLRIGATRFGRGSMLGKVADYLSYYLGVGWKLWVMRPRPDRIVALTTPPYLSVVARVMSKLRGADHAHWVMDLYPDVMVAHGMLRAGGVAHRLLAGLARWGFGGRRCAALLTLGPDMAGRLADLCGTAEHPGIEWVPLWGSEVAGVQCSVCREEKGKAVEKDCSGGSVTVAPVASGVSDEHDVNELDSQASHSAPLGESAAVTDAPQQLSAAALRRQRGWRDDEMVVMYSGNMGLGHRFGEILEVIGKECGMRSGECGVRVEAEHPRPPTSDRRPPIPNPQSPIRFVFYGGGGRRGEIEAWLREHPGAPVELHDYAPAEILEAHLRSADLHLASLDPAWTGMMVPSKLQGIFAAGRPVGFIGSAESSIGRWVAESGGGWVLRPGDVAGLLEMLVAASDPATRRARGQAARAYALEHFDKATNVARAAAILAAPMQGPYTKGSS